MNIIHLCERIEGVPLKNNMQKSNEKKKSTTINISQQRNAKQHIGWWCLAWNLQLISFIGSRQMNSFMILSISGIFSFASFIIGRVNGYDDHDDVMMMMMRNGLWDYLINSIWTKFDRNVNQNVATNKHYNDDSHLQIIIIIECNNII